ncbi:restriction endonuclease subunit S [Pseudomonas chlororaphis]|uniref:restriction endonuclease subunit S n=1 Tax=Pseudomonas chlororaphis TaxID=587753 RepID=UPI000E0CAA70|nr:restriction endonuclease subunit S [Pseudomonas chlororaphis]AZD15335.1 Type I restriction-modification system, specificity subunit S [Pseudomonas chlororaphis]WDH49759.1 restriction endonuclease subunit S [Pseudomonas chlororaphis]WDH61609.1 restriction endonuclease subunit S [Pseudomonas chlororaphis]WQE20864.1 restriction endonuclease subunit S [Pseudomonas chlororaphis]
MSNVRLGDVATLITKGTTPTTVGGRFASHGINFVKSESIAGSKYLNSDIFEKIDEETDSKLKRSRLKKGDLLFSIAGAYLAKVAIVRGSDVPANTNQAVGIVRLKHDIVDKDYAYYFYSQRSITAYINKLSSQSSQPNLNLDLLGRLPFDLKAYVDQQKIAAVLSALDAKIDCNKRINADLEAMAKTLYDYWFVQFDFPDANGKPYKFSGGRMVYNAILKREIPASWTDGTLNDLGQIVGGSTPSTKKPDNFTAKGTPWITPNDLSDNQGNKFITRGAQDVSQEGIKDASLKKYPAGTVLLSSRAPIGYMAIARAELTTNQGFKSFIPCNGYSSEFIYYTVMNSLKAITQYASGSTFKEVSGAVLKTVKITRPERSVVESFTKRVEPFFRRQDLLEQENQQLTQLRDWLLPMLMNGQVTVA